MCILFFSLDAFPVPPLLFPHVHLVKRRGCHSGTYALPNIVHIAHNCFVIFSLFQESRQVAGMRVSCLGPQQTIFLLWSLHILGFFGEALSASILATVFMDIWQFNYIFIPLIGFFQV